MCSELLRIPYEIAGVPIFGVGVLLAVWALASAVTLAGLVRRYGSSLETWSSLPVLLLVGAAIVLLPRVFPEGLPIRGYGLMLLAGIAAGVGLAMYRARQGGLQPDTILSLAIWIVICGVIGARLFYVVQYWEKFAGRSPSDTLLEFVNIPEGGLVIYGGFFGAVVGFLIFVRKHGLPFWAMADLVAPSLMIGLALGRVGCLMNGCCYGEQTDLPWAVAFPQYSSRFETERPPAERRHSPPYADQASRGELHGFRLETRGEQAAVVARVDAGSSAEQSGLRPGQAVVAVNGTRVETTADARRRIFALFEAEQPLQLQLSTGESIVVQPVPPPTRSRPVHPTQIYSAIDAGLLAWLLWAFFPFRRRDGEAVALMLTIHPITRYFLEVVRTDEPQIFAGMTISQNISVVLLVCAAALWWHLSRQPRGVTWPLARESSTVAARSSSPRRR